MARMPRIEYTGALYHVMSRGNRGDGIFADDDDHRRFLSCLGESCKKTGWMVHAYVLMSNHYHLLLETPEANLVAGMRWLQGVYAQRFNSRHRLRGHLFQGRYKALLIDPESKDHFLAVSSYIHLNPARTGLQGGFRGPLREYEWSSFPQYLGPASWRAAWLSVDAVLGCLGLRDDYRSRKRYGNYIDGCAAELSSPGGTEGFERQWKAIRRGWYLGGEGFRGRLLENLGRKIKGFKRDSFERRVILEHGENQAESLVSRGLEILGLPESQLEAVLKNDPRKQALAWLLRKNTTVTISWVGSRLKMGYEGNVTKAVRNVDKSRPGQALNELKRELLAMLESQD